MSSMLASLKTLKETLKPCSSSSSSSTSNNYHWRESQEARLTRKPPKSNLSQQLLRLGEPSFPSLDPPLSQPASRVETPRIPDGRDEDEDEEEEKQERVKLEGFGRPKSARVVYDHTGPYEPLLLSFPGEQTPIVKPTSSRYFFEYEMPPLRLLNYEEVVQDSVRNARARIGIATAGSFGLPTFPSRKCANLATELWEGSPGSVPASINCRLLEHQREGVKFLYRLYINNHGGILGDDMGLGKTIQTIAFLAAVYGKEGEPCDSGMLKERKGGEKGPVLIICPTSVIHNWESEFSTWATFNVAIYQGSNRDLILEKLEAHGAEILITSFDTFRIYGSILVGIKWEIVVVDEAHRLKNDKSKLYAACLQIGTRKRIGLTGTVMQNKIMELFNLFDWVAPGSLGTREHFREFYDEPLKHGQRSGAPERFVRVADKRKEHLVTVLRKYMIRRTKEETIGHLMMGKEDNVVFCAMSELQKRVYRRMLQLPEIQCLVNKDLPCSCGSPLKQVECCKRTVPDGIIWSYLHRDNPEGCDSCPFCLVLPCLVKLQQVSNHLELVKPNPKDEEDKQKKDAEFCSAVFGADLDLVGGNSQNEDFMGLSDVKHCGKMRVLEKLLSSWTSRGDKILLFSYSVRMLDILEKFIIRKGYSFSRLDGSTPTNIRQFLVDDFNKSPSKQVFLISTRAGGLGLNLVSANRVVIFDPNWNPAQDLQAQDRSFRFGQKRHVVVFRLLAAGSFEELIYSRQIYKQQLANIAVSGKTEKRYFEGVQDCKELQGELFGICNLFRDLSDELFTSGIIKLHEGQREGRRHDSILTQQLGELGTNNHTQTYADDPRPESSQPVLEELGVLYAHRNEDVVNNRSGEDTTREVGAAVSVKDMSSDDVAVDANKDGNKNRKRIHYRLLAKFTGMEVLEFSKWVLSATQLERKDILRDYARNNTIQRKRKKRPKH